MIKRIFNFKLLLLLIFLLLVAGWFYWFQFRPSEIRKACSTKRTEYIEKSSRAVAPRFMETVIEGLDRQKREQVSTIKLKVIFKSPWQHLAYLHFYFQN